MNESEAEMLLVKSSHSGKGRDWGVLGGGDNVAEKQLWPGCLGIAWNDSLRLPGPESSLQSGYSCGFPGPLSTVRA